ncbi:AAA family ATPase [Terrimonas pollutisoli]|uniref:AAA family ATPase n=1 Tax=Terrimonas pollutisoli TaxID=3034147 RepID=UPI0023EADB47|nr:AAA family ATPase [Terrimonas sp. H1YJ31]
MKKIKSIEIKNSTFFEDIKIDFSEKLNCIMGGRGTGKTTLLYFLKTALSKDESSAFNILKNNLGNGQVIVEIEVDKDSSYRITKSFNDEPQPFKTSDGVFISIDRIISDVECDIYEAGAIEQIGRNSQDRLKLLDKKILSDVAELAQEIETIQIDLESNSQEIKTINARFLQIDEKLRGYENIEAELMEHKERQPSGIKEEEQREFEIADSSEKTRNGERRLVDRITSELTQIKDESDARLDEIKDFERTNIPENADNFLNKELINIILKDTKDVLEVIKINYSKSKEVIESFLSALVSKSSSLKDNHDLQQAEFVKLKQKFDDHKEYINKYNRLTKTLDEKAALLKDKEEKQSKRQKIKQRREQLVKKLNEYKQTLFNKRLGCIIELNEKFKGEIKISLTFGGIVDEYEERLRSALKGSGLRYNELIPKIIQKFNPDEFAKLVHNRDIESLKTITGIDAVRSEALVNALHETDAIYSIEGLYCPDLPEFLLKVRTVGELESETYRKSDELSMGQRCTTVLPIVFAVSNNPLVIDQPEDNLDNKYISGNIHEIIRDQKADRQLIFITHNPNIPVLSEAEYNIFLTFDNLAKIEKDGSVDEVKENIIKLLEGGEEAFLKRKNIYGY